MSTRRNFYLAIAVTYIAAMAGAYLNLVYFHGENFPKGNFIMLGAIVAASALCRLIGNTPLIITIAFISLSGAVGMLSSVVAHSAVNSAPSLHTYDASIFWQSLLISLVFSSTGALLGNLGRFMQGKSARSQHT